MNLCIENLEESLTEEEISRLQSMEIYRELQTIIHELIKGTRAEEVKDRLVAVLMSAAGNYGMYKELRRLLELISKDDKTFGDVVEINILTFKMMMQEVINTIDGKNHDLDMRMTRDETRRIVETAESELQKIREMNRYDHDK